ncbi:uncharacterized protein DAT39_007242, partial [Clarias magur]
MDCIPEVDFDIYKLGISNVSDQDLQELCKEFYKAFIKVGFVYLKNTGIDQKEVNDVMEISKKFFLLPEDEKKLFRRGSYLVNVNHGWVSLETESTVCDQDLQELCKEIHKAFIEVGFVYLKNTGIDQNEVNGVMDISKKFFLLPEEQKRPFKRGSYSINLNHGWVSSETESLNPQRPGDLKEAFNTTSLCADIKWPSGGLDDFRDIYVNFFLRCKELSLRVLRVMALSLGLDSEIFLKAHSHIGSDKNDTTLRTLYYPPVQAESVKKDQLRCGEHSDYGSISLLFQDPEEGLQ